MSVPVDVLDQALHDAENQPSQFGTVPTPYLERAELMIDDLLHQFGHAGCTCCFPDKACCGFARADHYIALRKTGELPAVKGDAA